MNKIILCEKIRIEIKALENSSKAKQVITSVEHRLQTKAQILIPNDKLCPQGFLNYHPYPASQDCRA